MQAQSITSPALAWQSTLSAGLAALGFFLPFSSAGTSVALAVLLLLALLRAGSIWSLAPWREPVIAAGLALLAWIGLSLLWVEGWGPSAGQILNHYHELLMVPLLWGLLRLARRPELLMRGLFAGALAFGVLQWLAPLDARLAEWLLARRISGSFALGIAAFLLFEHARAGLLPRHAWAGALFLAATVLFAIGGRTGHVVLFVLLACAGWRAAPRRWRAPAVVAVLLAGALAASLSTVVQERVHETLSAVRADERGVVHDSPTGLRIQLLRGAVAVAADHFLTGTGWQAYPQAYQQAAAAHQRDGEPAGIYGINPHNEYLLQLGAGGMAALALFLLWLGWPMVQALRSSGSGSWAGALGCVALAFATGCLFNSLLLDFTEGHVYAAVLAWLLAARERAG